MSEECRAENCKGKHPHRRFCVNGHDTFETGRRASRHCVECRNQKARERYVNDEVYRGRLLASRRTPERKERRNARRRERYSSDPEYRKKKQELHRSRYASNPEYRRKRLALSRAWSRKKRHDPALRPETLERDRRAKRERYASDPKYREQINRKNLLYDRSTVGKAIEALDPRLKELFE